jgi:hypothetical protein
MLRLIAFAARARTGIPTAANVAGAANAAIFVRCGAKSESRRFFAVFRESGRRHLQTRPGAGENWKSPKTLRMIGGL